jgi:polysaccharide export outer membrane protein
MGGGTSAALLRDIQTLFDTGTAAGLTDRQLLERFACSRDATAETAFEVLVLRHGPMVLRVCRNVLHDPNDAQDAFQATFLVLVRRRGAVGKLESLGGWLYGVAHRVALRARVEAARRRAVEARAALQVVEAFEPDVSARMDPQAYGPIVQEEVRRLPEKYRAAVVLCYWEGLTHEQAAVQLGIPLGTVRSRIARARDLLRRRLTHRGSAPVAGIVAAGVDATSGSLRRPPQISSELVNSTVQAASRIAAGHVVSGPVASLVQRILWSMTMIKLCKLVTGLSVLALTIWGVSLWAQQPEARRPRGRPQTRPEHTPAVHGKAAPALKDGPAHVIEPPDLVLVEILEAAPGRPISGERLVRPDGTISLGFYGAVHVAGLTLPEAKEKIVQHMQKFLNDDTLGLVETDPATDAPVIDPKTNNVKRIDPKDTTRVFVDVTAYNSRNYYVEGEVCYPERIPFTGRETVLDVLHFVGGPTPAADRSGIRLIRSYPVGSPVQVLPIDYEEITMGTDSSTNYQILPGDRLVIPRDPSYSPPNATPVRPQQRAPQPPKWPPDLRSFPSSGSDDPADKQLEALRSLERHMIEVERKLDRIIEKMDRGADTEATPPEKPRTLHRAPPVPREEPPPEE